MILPADPGKLSNYKVIDNLGSFGMKDYDTMEEVWKDYNSGSDYSDVGGAESIHSIRRYAAEVIEEVTDVTMWLSNCTMP